MIRFRYPTTLLLLFEFILLLGACHFCAADELQTTDIKLQVGKNEVISCNKPTRVVIADPSIADIALLSASELLVNAKSPGKTILRIWNVGTPSVYNITVNPIEVDLESLISKIQTEINDPRVSLRGVENTIIIEGTVNSEAESSRAETIARAVTENSIFPGVSSGGSTQEIKSVSRPDGDSFILERNVSQNNTQVKADIGLRSPKVVNLLKITKPMGEVSVRTTEIAGAITSALNNPRLTVRALPGSVVLIEGFVGTESEQTQINQIIKGWSKEGKDNKGGIDGRADIDELVTIVNSTIINSSIAKQVIVHAQVLDINKNALKEIGVEWGRVIFDNNGNPIVEDQPFLIGERVPENDLLDIGKILRLDPLGARIRALVTQNKARVLSQPNLLVLDGREASMLVGGEIPIPVVQSASIGTAASVSVLFKEFGVKLRILPVITGDNSMQLKIMPEVSSLDFGNAVVFSGFVIPAFSTRRAETTVNILDGQSLMIGGLISKDTSKLVKKIPLLGDIPIIGELFKSRSYKNGDTELVIIVRPEILEPGASTPLELPESEVPSPKP
ncbi:MAG: type II and III secretion system protein family protein [Armatimonadota bacterium]